MTYEEKKLQFAKRMQELTKRDVTIAFSGGVDSSLLLMQACKMAKENGTKVHAVTMDTELHPKADAAIAQKVADEAGAIHHILVVDELKEAGIMDNPLNRCYRCKKHLFEKLLAFSKEQGTDLVLEGSNLDDLGQYRPGLLAVRELEIQSPLAECQFTKEDVRRLAGEYDISVANRPSTPCLATRFPYGTVLSLEAMKKVEEGEKILKEYGCYNVRLRIHENIVRIEVDADDMICLLEQREEITKRLKKLGYEYITLDLEGFRSGSMDIGM